MTLGQQIASLYGLVDIDDRLTPGLQTAKGNLGSFASSMGSSLKNVGSQVTKVGAGVTAIGLPFAAFGLNAVNSAGESQLALAQLNAVLESTGGAAGLSADQLTAMADGLQQQTRYGDEAVIGAESLLLSFTQIGEDVFPQALQATLDMSTAMGQDLSSSAVMLGKAINSPAEGLTALTRVGVTFDEGQRAMIESMVAAGDVAGAQKIILAELTKEFGGSAVAAGETFPGKLDILKNKFGEVEEKIGLALINALDPLTVTLGDLATGFSNLDKPTQETLTKVLLIGGAMAIAGPVITGVGVAISALGTGLGFVLSPAGLLILAIGGIIAAAETHYPGGIKALFKDASLSAKQLADVFFMSLIPGAKGAEDAITKALTTLAQMMQIADMLRTGQISPAAVINAIGQEVAGNPGSVLSGLFTSTKVPIISGVGVGGDASSMFGANGGSVAVGGDATSSFNGSKPNAGSSLNIHGDVHITANNWAEAEKEFINRSYGRG